VQRLQLVFIVALLGITAPSCARALAKAEVPLPELAPPPPPPRVVEVYADEPLPTVDPGPAETALNTPPVRPPARPAAAKPEPPKPEPARTEPERPVSTPALVLKPAPGVAASTEASIRNMLGRASKDLNRVNYAALDADGRTQYDTAKRFMQQADEALRGGNLVFAGKLADKAATMASVLVR
jgi:hypothetical protein